MSLSKLIKDKTAFKAEQLVPRKAQTRPDWRAVSLSSSRTEPSPAGSGAASQQLETAPIGAAPNGAYDNDHPAGTADPVDLPDTTAGPGDSEHPDERLALDIEALQKKSFQAGVDRGRKQAESEFGSSVRALELACEQLSSIRETILKNSKEEIFDLVIALSEKIIRHSVTEQDRTIIDTVEEALGQAVRSSEFYIYLNPDDVAVIKERSVDFIASLNGLDNIVVKQDQAIERGGCRIESENCTVDATIGSQLAIVSERIRADL
jgi:flagellar assembly protein FliH